MKRRRFHRSAAILPAAVGLFCALDVPATDEPPMPLWRVERTDGEPLRCGIEEFDAASGHWVFRMEFSRRPFAMDGEKIARLRPIIRAAPSWAPHWVLETTDGDQITGADPRMDDRSVELIHAHAGAVSIERRRAALLRRETEPTLLYEGFRMGEIWESPRGAVRAGPDGLTIHRPYSAGRRIEGLARRICIDFTLSGYAGFNLWFYFGLDRPIGRHAYQMRVLKPSAIELFRFRPEGLTRLTRRGMETRMPPNGPIQCQLLADLDAGLFFLTVNGRSATAWNDDGAPAETVGEWLVFQPNDASLRIEELRVSRWDGRHPAHSPTDRDATAEDTLELLNGDVIEGQIVAFRGGRVVFRSRFGEMAVPSDRVARIRFPHPRVEPAASASAGQYRLADGSRLYLELRGIKNGAVTGRWQGRLLFRFPLELLEEVVWPNRVPAAPPATPQGRAIQFSNRIRASVRRLAEWTRAARFGRRSRSGGVAGDFKTRADEVPADRGNGGAAGRAPVLLPVVISVGLC